MRKYIFAGALLLAGAAAAAAEDAVPAGVDTGGGKQEVSYKQTYDQYGDVATSESDTDGDGVMDEKITYEDGVAVKVEKDTDGDGKMDDIQEPAKAAE
jgi:hypothetical protein